MSEEARRLYLGIDVQASRGCPYALLDEHGEPRDAGWLDARPADATKKLAALIGCHEDGHSCRVAVGIDAPRLPLPSPRRWYWDGACRRWRQARPSEGGNGRHSEIVIAAHRIANPQWTPHRQFPDWMQLGFALFAALGAR
ncbi:MAG TPA: hypothetical protein VMG58_17550, partial [Candidatus Sulfotelmatobacter sp.]|nr:hypothetical protein [Candidatus Sulfotelmatobacter sp.]